MLTDERNVNNNVINKYTKEENISFTCFTFPFTTDFLVDGHQLAWFKTQLVGRKRMVTSHLGLGMQSGFSSSLESWKSSV